MPRPRILIVEDDPDIKELLHIVLEAEGYPALSATRTLDPPDVAQLRPGLMMLDSWLRGTVQGWDLLQALRQSPGTCRVPVICTADPRATRVEPERLQELVAEVVLKPFELDDFLGRGATACGGP